MYICIKHQFTTICYVSTARAKIVQILASLRLYFGSLIFCHNIGPSVDDQFYMIMVLYHLNMCSVIMPDFVIFL